MNHRSSQKKESLHFVGLLTLLLLKEKTKGSGKDFVKSKRLMTQPL
jgi:hypothetical protein